VLIDGCISWPGPRCAALHLAPPAALLGFNTSCVTSRDRATTATEKPRQALAQEAPVRQWLPVVLTSYSCTLEALVPGITSFGLGVGNCQGARLLLAAPCRLQAVASCCGPPQAC
jgi:hypothetical protein